MAMVGVVNGSRIQADHRPSRLAWSEGWRYLAPNHIHQMNRVNSRNDFMSRCHDDSTINIDLNYYYYYITLFLLVVLDRYCVSVSIHSLLYSIGEYDISVCVSPPIPIRLLQ